MMANAKSGGTIPINQLKLMNLGTVSAGDEAKGMIAGGFTAAPGFTPAPGFPPGLLAARAPGLDTPQ